VITLHNSQGLKVLLHRDAIARVVETGASSQWHGIKAVVTTFDGQRYEVGQTVREIEQLIEADAAKAAPGVSS
jgi:hypothetical protein